MRRPAVDLYPITCSRNCFLQVPFGKLDPVESTLAMLHVGGNCYSEQTELKFPPNCPGQVVDDTAFSKLYRIPANPVPSRLML
jgi:hypothetical protein